MGAEFKGIEGDEHSYTPNELAVFKPNRAQSITFGTNIQLKHFKVEINLGNIDPILAKDYLTAIVTKNIKYVMTDPKPKPRSQLDDIGKFIFVISAPGFDTDEEEIKNMIKKFTTTYKIVGKDINDNDIVIKIIDSAAVEKLYPEKTG